ncbi:MAG TPA: hypothetical protein DEO59_10855 [Balneola sp.]|nr:hypothetical protein [Balneola sp.]MAO79039.1 hypothetical protein [Balneola sp.]MBF63698.1 hypothetical protein [Balneola sp.]HBZ38938.1 hypothetical protein [Balneola sp.]|tara:strand:+ start:17667 stop:18539 length:873 start_codon:yes stop_codon:yes gene_type:complete
MKKITILFLLTFSINIVAHAQQSTEVYLFDLTKTESGFELTNPVNASDNEGYDNQPSFTKDGKALLFASTRNEQTDILWYDIQSGNKSWLSTTLGGEYSPVLTPDGTHISAVRLDPDGLQLLYQYSIKDKTPQVLIPDLKIGYYAWISEATIVAFVLGEPATLQKINVATGKSELLQNNPGRSIHRIPGTQDFSFVDKTDPDTWIIMRSKLNDSQSVEQITSTLPGAEDMAWIDDRFIVMGNESNLYIYDLQNKNSNKWELLADLSNYNLNTITRLAYHNGKLAVVVNGK